MGSIVYAGHQQNVGNLSTVSDGETLGKTGQSLRMENISITLENMQTPITGGVQYRAHVQNDGWKSWVSNGKEGGTHGQSKRMEAVQIKLAGTIELFCDVWYGCTFRIMDGLVGLKMDRRPERQVLIIE